MNIKNQVLKRQTELLQKDKCGRGFICPLCGSGTGSKGTGMTTKDGTHYTCFACDGIHNDDIFEIIGKQFELKSFPEKLRKCCELLGIPYKSEPEPLIFDAPPLPTDDDAPPEVIAPRVESDFAVYYKQAAECINDTEYHRGLSAETLAKFRIGYDSSWVNPKNPKAKPSKRLIIPVTDESYLARSTDSDDEYSKIFIGSKEFLNFGCINTAKEPVFIVEGELDALSIIDVGGQAVSLSGLANVNAFLKRINGHKPACPMIIALDNEDKPNVRKATESLQKGLEEMGILSVAVQPYGDCKDANDALCSDRTTFAERIKSAISSARSYSPDDKFKAGKTAAELVEKFKSDRVSALCYPTGFTKIDKALDGGFYKGLYTIGAISALGKTTLCMNLADNLAQSGVDVMFFSLEMDSAELVAKSLSRISYQELHKPKTTRDILSRTHRLSDEDKATLLACATLYSERIGEHLFIVEGMGKMGVNEIRAMVEKHIDITGKPCVVFIDYLQIMEPMDIRATDKQNTDRAVKNLKIMSRDLDIPVVAISSFNRENYEAPVSLSCFKESGAIEYSADCLIGLQYSGIDYCPDEKKEDRTKRILELHKTNETLAGEGKEIKIDFRVLKERHGSKGTAVLDFCPKFNSFREEKEAEPLAFEELEF